MTTRWRRQKWEDGRSGIGRVFMVSLATCLSAFADTLHRGEWTDGRNGEPVEMIRSMPNMRPQDSFDENAISMQRARPEEGEQTDGDTRSKNHAWLNGGQEDVKRDENETR